MLISLCPSSVLSCLTPKGRKSVSLLSTQQSGWTDGNVSTVPRCLALHYTRLPLLPLLPWDLSLSHSAWHPGTPDLSVASLPSPSRLGGALNSF